MGLRSPVEQGTVAQNSVTSNLHQNQLFWFLPQMVYKPFESTLNGCFCSYSRLTILILSVYYLIEKLNTVR